MEKIKIAKKTLFWFVVCFILYCVLFLFIDRPVDIWMHSFSGTWFFSLGTFLSFFASKHLILNSLLFLLIIIVIHDGVHGQTSLSKKVLYICVSIIIAKTIGDGLKYLLGRHRPVELFDKGLYGLTFLGNKWELQSTPSGHSVRIFSAMCALSLSFRKYRFYFLGLALAVGISRVMVTAHYPSDVLFGGFLGVAIANLTYEYVFKLKDT